MTLCQNPNRKFKKLQAASVLEANSYKQFHQLSPHHLQPEKAALSGTGNKHQQQQQQQQQEQQKQHQQQQQQQQQQQ